MVAQTVKDLLVMQKTQVWSLGQEEPLEKGKATHFSSLTCRIPWTEEPGELQSMGLQRVGHDRATNTFKYAYLMPGALQTLLQFFSTPLKMNWLPHQWESAGDAVITNMPPILVAYNSSCSHYVSDYCSTGNFPLKLPHSRIPVI